MVLFLIKILQSVRRLARKDRRRSTSGPPQVELYWIYITVQCANMYPTMFVKYVNTFLSLWESPSERILSYHLITNCSTGFQEDIWMEKINRSSPKLSNVVNLWYAMPTHLKRWYWVHQLKIFIILLLDIIKFMSTEKKNVESNIYFTIFKIQLVSRHYISMFLSWRIQG